MGDRILRGATVDALPSLKLSSLTYQIKEGFTMHVLPLLLRRKDVHVHLTSRAHRQTTYDIAVTVTPTAAVGSCNDYECEKVSDAGSESNHHHYMAFQATRHGATMKEKDDFRLSSFDDKARQPSTATKPFLGRSAMIPGVAKSFSNAGSTASAVTSPISNKSPWTARQTSSRAPQVHRRSRYASLSAEMKRGDAYPMPNLMSDASPSLGDDLSVGSSSVDDDTDGKHSQHQSGIMERAFGLLSRRKPSPITNKSQRTSDGHSSMFQTPKREASLSAANSSENTEHPHHRVVSAPPGKIGITFVEYRGHAMVSNVSEDSPLAGWVFPSDVLIAIDDIPVNGLRTRDIVKLLTSRVGKQRNLRIVSSVAMNDLIPPGTV